MLISFFLARNENNLSISIVTKGWSFEDYESESDTSSTLRIQFGGMDYFSRILRTASRNLKLARLLWERVVPYSANDVISEGKQRMAISSLDYIEVRRKIPCII